MARIPVFLSFYYDDDVMRVQQVRNMGVIDDKPLLSPNAFEQIRRRGKAAIRAWIDENMKYKRCLIVLIGSRTAERPWVRYEIEKAWGDGKGVFGIHIHNLKDPRTGTSAKGANPFEGVPSGGLLPLDWHVSVYDPPFYDAYNHIANNIQGWIEAAIAQRR